MVDSVQRQKHNIDWLIWIANRLREVQEATEGDISEWAERTAHEAEAMKVQISNERIELQGLW